MSRSKEITCIYRWKECPNTYCSYANCNTECKFYIQNKIQNKETQKPIKDKIWRNDMCKCWSWKKYKKCCLLLSS